MQWYYVFTEPADAPTNFISTVLNSTAIKLTWDEPLLPYGVLVSYTITYNTSNGNVSQTKDATDPREVVIGSLEEHTRYKFEIVASTRIGSGPSVSLITRTDISGIYTVYKGNVTYIPAFLLKHRASLTTINNHL